MVNRLKILLLLLVGLFLAAGCHDALATGHRLQDFVGTDGSSIQLHNNTSAVDVSYSDLVNFVDHLQYSTGPCLQLAGFVHDQAEASGIRAGVLIIVNQINNHAVAVFQTTDRGKVYVDLDLSQEVVTGETLKAHHIITAQVYEFW